jgi:hypothetical protein
MFASFLSTFFAFTEDFLIFQLKLFFEICYFKDGLHFCCAFGTFGKIEKKDSKNNKRFRPWKKNFEKIEIFVGEKKFEVCHLFWLYYMRCERQRFLSQSKVVKREVSFP